MSEISNRLQILLIDCYDSYTFNLYDLLYKASENACVIVVHWDKMSPDLWEDILQFDAIVVGPGPGHPAEYSSILNRIWQLNIPVMGICLGFQSLALYHGATIERMPNLPWHGRVSSVTTSNTFIFDGISAVKGMRYHSLYANKIPIDSLQILAQSDEDNIVMSIKATNFPHFGILYHPESVGSSESLKIFKNFLSLADTPNIQCVNSFSKSANGFSHNLNRYDISPAAFILKSGSPSLQIHSVEIPWVEPLALADCIQKSGDPICFLDSAKKPGRYSILGILTGPLARIIHYEKATNTTEIRICKDNSFVRINNDLWSTVADFMNQHKAIKPDTNLPFYGGIMGIIGYECSDLSTKSVSNASFPLDFQQTTVDAELAFVDRSFVFDLETKKLFVQTLTPLNETCSEWWGELLASTCNTKLDNLSCLHSFDGKQNFGLVQSFPKKEVYCESVKACQEHLLAGDSYEMCLTDTTFVSAPPELSDFEMYMRARSLNPATFAGFVRLNHFTLLCCSPERFLQFRDDRCLFSPIKGTLKREGHMSLEEARKKLLNEKDMGELNMIIDLIRNDLHQLAKKNSVHVPELYSVEEHSNVYSLLSNIYGRIESPITAWDVLSKSFPPGSMTGAPKLRSVRMLEPLEQHGRGIYSGTLGYWDVTGSAEFNVIIRSAFKYKADDYWRIGAGGAVTILSSPEGEYEEMVLKANSILPAFVNLKNKKK